VHEVSCLEKMQNRFGAEKNRFLDRVTEKRYFLFFSFERWLHLRRNVEYKPFGHEWGLHLKIILNLRHQLCQVKARSSHTKYKVTLPDDLRLINFSLASCRCPERSCRVQESCTRNERLGKFQGPKFCFASQPGLRYTCNNNAEL